MSPVEVITLIRSVSLSRPRRILMIAAEIEGSAHRRRTVGVRQGRAAPRYRRMARQEALPRSALNCVSFLSGKPGDSPGFQFAQPLLVAN